jgi:hypothetical protein
MTCSTYRWSVENIERAKQILGEHRDLATAIEAIADALGFDVSRHSADSAFRKAGLPSPFTFLKKRSPRIPPVDERDTERMEIATAVPLPDDSATTIPSSSPSVTPADQVGMHRMRQRLASFEVRTRALLQELAAKEDELSNFKAVARTPRPIEVPKTAGGTQRKGVPVLLCSDWHVGEEVSPETVNGLNVYNTEIAAKCIDRLADGFEWMLRDDRFDCRTAVIALMGDMMTGYIHPELVENNLLSPPEEQVFLIDHCERFLAILVPDRQRAWQVHLRSDLAVSLTHHRWR